MNNFISIYSSHWDPVWPSWKIYVAFLPSTDSHATWVYLAEIFRSGTLPIGVSKIFRIVNRLATAINLLCWKLKKSKKLNKIILLGILALDFEISLIKFIKRWRPSLQRNPNRKFEIQISWNSWWGNRYKAHRTLQ